MADEARAAFGSWPVALKEVTATQQITGSLADAIASPHRTVAATLFSRALFSNGKKAITLLLLEPMRLITCFAWILVLVCGVAN